MSRSAPGTGSRARGHPLSLQCLCSPRAVCSPCPPHSGDNANTIKVGSSHAPGGPQEPEEETPLQDEVRCTGRNLSPGEPASSRPFGVAAWVFHTQTKLYHLEERECPSQPGSLATRSKLNLAPSPTRKWCAARQIHEGQSWLGETEEGEQREDSASMAGCLGHC